MTSVTVTPEVTGAEAPAPADTTPQRPDFIPEKFWDAEKGEANIEAMAKAHAELESKFGSQGNDQGGDDKPSEDAPNEDAKDGDDDQNLDEDSEVFKALVDRGLDPKHYSLELEQNGSLSDDSYAQLAEAGFPRAVVDQYLAGANAAETVEAAGKVLAEKQIAEVKAVAGGDEGFKAIQEWAANNASQEDLQTYNDMVNSGNVAQAKAAVSWLKGMYEDANGREPNLLGGEGRAPAAEPFRSSAQVVEAMSDPRYKSDPAYREDVAKRLAASNLW